MLGCGLQGGKRPHVSTHYGKVRKLWRPSWDAGRRLPGQEDRPACNEGVEVTAPTTEGEEEGS